MKDETYFDEQTLFKVQRALFRAGIKQNKIQDCITEMLNDGILFRERVAPAQEETDDGT